MPFLIPVAGAIGAGISAAAATTLGSALIQGAIGLGLSFAASALTSKTANNGTSGYSGTRVNARMDPNAPKQVVVGKTLTFGNIGFWHVSADQIVQSRVMDLAHHRCDGLEPEIWINGRLETLDLDTGIVSGFGGKLKIRFYDGAPGQTADAILVANSDGRWKATARGTSVCYAIIEATGDPKYFPSGFPEVGFVLRGACFYDRRKDSTAGGTGPHRFNDATTHEWTENPAVMVDHLLAGFSPAGVRLMGLHCAQGVSRFDDFASAANACEEQIALGEGGTEDRYRCGAVFDATTTNQPIIETILGSMAGKLIEVGGLYRIQAGVTQPIVAHLTDADLYVDESFKRAPLLSRSSLVNGVHAAFADPTRQYAPVPLPARQSSLDVAQDKGSWIKTLDLTGVSSRTQAQRIQELERKRARRMLISSATFRAYWNKLEPGDWFTFTSERAGWINQAFEVSDKTDNENQSVGLSYRAVDAELDDWSILDEIGETETVDLGPGGPLLTTVSGLSVTTFIVTSGGSSQLPALHVSWTPILDPTCVSVRIEYRELGSDVVLTVVAVEADFGSYDIVQGIQGYTTYEVRAIPVTIPDRPLNWSAWVSSPDVTDPQIVNVGTIDIVVAPDSITPDMLSPQVRREIELITKSEEVQGSVAERLAFVAAELQRLGSAQLDHRAETSGTYARVRQTVVEQAGINSAFAQFKIEVEAALGGISGPVATAILDLQARVDAGEDGLASVLASATLAINADGNVALIRLDGTEIATLISFVADEFVFAKPGGLPGEVIQLVTIATIGGEDKLVLNFDEILIPDGAIKAEHLDVVSLDAISANFGSAQFSGLVRSASGSAADLRLDFDVGSLEIIVP